MLGVLRELIVVCFGEFGDDVWRLSVFIRGEGGVRGEERIVWEWEEELTPGVQEAGNES